MAALQRPENRKPTRVRILIVVIVAAVLTASASLVFYNIAEFKDVTFKYDEALERRRNAENGPKKLL